MNTKSTLALLALCIISTLFACISTGTNHWATVSEDEGISCEISIRSHTGLYWIYDAIDVNCPGGSISDSDRSSLDCSILKDESDFCHTLYVARLSAIIACCAAGLSAIPAVLLYQRQRSYSFNKELLILVAILFIVGSVAAVFSLLAAEMFREFISDADEYTVEIPTNPSQEYNFDVTWKFSYSWILMISSSTIQILVLLMTLFVYYERAQVQQELESQLFI